MAIKRIETIQSYSKLVQVSKEADGAGSGRENAT